MCLVNAIEKNTRKNKQYNAFSRKRIQSHTKYGTQQKKETNTEFIICERDVSSSGQNLNGQQFFS